MEFLQNSCSVLRDRKRTQDPVAIAKWTHLNSSRTQKLSTFTATIVGLAPAKIASCRVLFFYIKILVSEQGNAACEKLSNCHNLLIMRNDKKDYRNSQHFAFAF